MFGKVGLCSKQNDQSYVKFRNSKSQLNILHRKLEKLSQKCLSKFEQSKNKNELETFYSSLNNFFQHYGKTKIFFFIEVLKDERDRGSKSVVIQRERERE